MGGGDKSPEPRRKTFLHQRKKKLEGRGGNLELADQLEKQAFIVCIITSFIMFI